MVFSLGRIYITNGPLSRFPAQTHPTSSQLRYTMLLFHYDFKLSTSPMLGVPKTTPRFGASLGGCNIIQHIAVLVAMIYFSERIQHKSAKGKATWGGTRGNQALASKRLLSVQSHRKHLIPPNCDSICGQLIRDSALRVFMGGGGSYRYSVPSMNQNSRHSEGFQHKPYCLHKQFKHSVTFL